MKKHEVVGKIVDVQQSLGKNVNYIYLDVNGSIKIIYALEKQFPIAFIIRQAGVYMKFTLDANEYLLSVYVVDPKHSR